MRAVVDIEFDRKNMQKMYAMRMDKHPKDFDKMSDTEFLQVCLSSITKPYAIKVTDIKDKDWEYFKEMMMSDYDEFGM